MTRRSAPAPAVAVRRATGPPARRVARLLAAFVAASAGTGVLAAGLVLPAVTVVGSATRSTVAAVDALPADLETQPLAQQSRILYADGSPMATFSYENRIEVPLDAVAPVMRQAIVAIEDARFWQHGGVDPRGIARAIVNNASGSGVQGASTLTQQWIKNLQVERAVSALPPDATTAQRQRTFAAATQSTGVAGYARKVREIGLAIAAQKELSKAQVLDDYLNITSFGDGQYGIEAASRHYFDRSAHDLDLPDAALMAGVVQNPILLDPVTHPDAALARRDVVLDRMLAQGMVTAAQHDRAVAVPLAQQLHVQPIRNGCAQAGGAAFFCDDVYRSLLADPRMGRDAAARLRRIYRGGLTVTTTLDRSKQDAADATVKAAVPADTPQVGASLTTVEPGTGRVVAMAQNRYFTTSAHAPADATNYDYAVDRSAGGYTGFQTGSTYKAFVLADWLATGHTLSDTVTAPAAPVYHQARDFRVSPPCPSLKGAAPYRPGNSESTQLGRMSVLTATYDSVNTAYLEMARRLDLCQIRDTAAALGVHRADGRPLASGPASVLGDNDVAPLTMASAYAAFADGGTWCAAHVVDRVVDAAGATLLTSTPDCTPRLDPDVANTVTYALGRVLTQGTAAGYGIRWPAAGKTGTTNFEVGDTWFVGYTRQLSTAVYVGTPYTDTVPLSSLPVKGVRRAKVYGATFAAPIWQAFMTRAMAGLPQEAFPPPSGRLVGRG